LFDAQLSSKDRLVTADEFLGEDTGQAGHSGGFMQAAVADAETYVQKAMQTELDSLPMPDWRLRPISALGVLGAVAIALALIVGLGGVTAGERDITGETLTAALQADSAPGAANEQRLAQRRDARQPRDPEQEALTAADKQEASPATPQRLSKEEAAQGQSSASSSSAAQSSSNSSNAGGQPSSEKNASKPKEDEQPPEDKKRQDKQKKNAVPPPQKKMQLAMESSTGEGRSSGSSSSMSEFEVPEQQDKANAGTRQEDQGEESEDEDEEEKSNSSVKPDLRDRKAPVDRNLSPSPTGTEPDDDANGRSGPGGRKKTRGVPSMILGIPVADRVQGKPSPGRSKVTQENAKPTTESHPELQAQERLARTEAAGQVEQWQLLPWMQTLVRDYFTTVHEQTISDRSFSQPKVSEQ
jgi:hypothetical protein